MTSAALVVAGGGLLLLCRDGTGLAAVLAASGFFAVHLLLLGAAAGRVNSVHLIAVQSVVVAVVCAGPAAVDGTPHLTVAHWLLAAVLGVCVSGGAYLLQALGQAVVPVTTAGLLLMTEPVIAVLVGWLAGERPTAHQATGIGLLTLAILLAIRAPKRSNTRPVCRTGVEVTEDGAGGSRSREGRPAPSTDTGMADMPLGSAAFSSMWTITDPARISGKRRTNIRASSPRRSVGADRRKGS